MFDFERVIQAKSTADAIKALNGIPNSMIICGGSDVLVKIREGKLSGKTLVSINGLEELSDIRMAPDGTLVIGSACTFAQITENPLVQSLAPALGLAVDQAGGPQLRNVATVGGNLCNGATSADSAATLLTLDARLLLKSMDGERESPLEGFHVGPGKVGLKPGEVLTAIKIARADYEGFGGNYIKYAMRNAMDIATLGVAAHVRLNAEKNAIEAIRLAYGVAAPVPTRCRSAEESLRGRPLTRETLAESGTVALKELSPRDSWRASKAFRERLVLALTGRCLEQAILRAGGQVS
jgi:xanthine dehydrogenase FAD-binding subunit